ncbi:MAG: hypothetical protein COS30_02145 [Candidatus Portnoybacteria bacterium CG02_land_8_20_14_3_00_45_8]|uniref:HTH psq-type domain-containing protein n=1 Tax=Candidatus Portnoybacteria bacterium CG02_land_8_20_14_3_00_45_8 TaxID=1974807 RepID=A0A2M7D601_9BACT|nr:MAG: hypothetical protein COS30_02145 [Candidatus Portnoybacteria bacterium CG02_land_8_20_14_3_00_45_8]
MATSSNKGLKLRIISLRKRGKTHGEIREIYNVPKGTLSAWLKNIKISTEAKRKIQQQTYKRWKNANEIFIKRRVQEAWEKRTRIQNKSQREIKKVSLNDLKLIGAALYWAEGNQKYKNQLRFSNSNPEIIKIIMEFFRRVCEISNEKIKGRAHTYPDTNYNKTLNFWTKLTKLPKKNFYKPQIQISKASKRKRNILPYGTLHLNAGNTESMCKVRGWIQGIANKSC